MVHLYFLSVLFVLLTSTSSVFAVKCHQCGGAERFSEFEQQTVLNKLNISVDNQYGICRKRTGDDMCSNGTLCIKRAKVYYINYDGVNMKWTTYTKGCAVLREDNNQIPTNQCYELGQVSNATGYKAKRVDCYCDSNFCNGSSTPTITILSIVLSFTTFFGILNS